MLACLVPPASGAEAQSARELAFAKATLAELQVLSLRKNREFCGLFGFDLEGNLMATKARPGGKSSCAPYPVKNDVVIIASYHTHAFFDPRYDGEVPSVADVEGDMADGVDGYIATPGGRMWFIDGGSGASRQICGVGCLPMAAGYDPDAAGPISKSYTLAALRRREGG